MDLFVGSLVDYYVSGGQKQEAARKAVESWQDDLKASLAPHLSEELRLPRDTDNPLRRSADPRALRGLRLLSAYVQHSELDWPDELAPSLEEDPAWRKASAEDFGRSRFPQVQIPDLWWPGEFAFTARQPLPDGEEAIMGSIDGLALQLRLLNQQSLQLEGVAAAMQAVANPEPDAGFLVWAEHGLGLMLMAAGRAQQLRCAVLLR